MRQSSWMFFCLIAVSLVGCGRIGFDSLKQAEDAAPDGNLSDATPDTTLDASSDANDASIICGSDCSGTTQQWVKQFGDVGYDTGIDVAIDSNDNVYLGGTFSGTIDFGGGPLNELSSREIIVAGFDSNGTHRWSTVPTGPSGGGPWQIHDLGVDSTQGVVITGVPSPSGTNEAFLLASYDSSGTFRWGTHNADSVDWVYFAAVASDN